MTRFRTVCSSLAMALGFLLAGCGGAIHQSPHSPNDLQMKMMRYQQVMLHQRLFYVGIARAYNLQSATEQAYAEITKQLTWLPTGAPDLLVGLYRVDRTATDTEGNVHVLAVLEREDAGNHCRRLRDESRRTMGKDLTRCRLLLDAGETTEARECLADASRLLYRARTLHKASYSAVGDPAPAFVSHNSGDLQRLKDRISAASTRKRSVLIQVHKIVDGRYLGDINPEIAKVVSASGLKIASGTIARRQVDRALAGSTSAISAEGKKTGAGYIVVGKVDARFIGSEMGQYFATGNARLKVIETEGGRTMAELNSGTIKGGHISRDKALLRAAENAIKAVNVKLSGVLQIRSEWSRQ